MKKIASLVLAIALIFSLALPSYAAFHPSVVGGCGHKIRTVIVNNKEIDFKNCKDAILLVTAEDAAAANEALNPGKPNKMTSTGLTYAENAALVGMYNIARVFYTVPNYINGHKLSKAGADLPMNIAEKALGMTSTELNDYDFIHFFILKINEPLLKEAAGLKADEKITSLVLVFDCSHMTDRTNVLHEEDILPEGSFDNVEIADDEIVIHAMDVDFAADKAEAGTYTVSFDLTGGKSLPDYSLFTIVVKEK